jgi:hypothetical protein
MAVCCKDGQIIPAVGSADCERSGGTWYEDFDTCPGRPCAFLGALNKYLTNASNGDPVQSLAATGTFSSLYELRDEILAQSGLGQELISYYDNYMGSAVELLESAPDLLQEALQSFLVAARFGQSLLRVHHGTGDAAGRRDEFKLQWYETVVAVIARFRQLAANAEKDFEEPLAFLDHEIRPLIGRSAEEVLDILLNGTASAAGV